MTCTFEQTGLRPCRRPTRRGGGFSLVELLVVVAIIALLVAMVVPSFQAAKRRARAISCASNLHQIVTGLFCYARNNRRLMLPCRKAGSVSEDDMQLLYPQYVNNISAFRCPASQYDFPTTAEHIQYKTSRRSSYGERAQTSYEYPGEYVLTLTRRVDPRLGMLVYDDDGRGVNKETDVDAHAPDGGNMSFIDGRVDWIDDDAWPYFSRAGLYAWRDAE